MKCVIPGRGIKAFGKAIFCLTKIGEELYIEAQDDGLALKTVNSARSAYACFLFQRNFFLMYRDERPGGGQARSDDGESDAFKCKILAKSVLAVFRSLATLERTVDHCTLNLDLDDNKLVFIFHCKHGVVKTHNLGYQECDALQAVFTKELCPNHISAPAKVLSEVVTHFPTGLEEVTLTAQPASVKLRNYVEDDGDGNRPSLTEINLVPGEFDHYQVGVDTSITFCLKELRAVLMFTDAINHSLSLRFEAPGRPVVMSIEDGKEYKADFVLATLLDGNPPTEHAQFTSSQHRADDTGTHHDSIQHTQDPDDDTALDNTVMDTKRAGNSKMATHSSTSRAPVRPLRTVTDFPSGSQFHQPSTSRNSQFNQPSTSRNPQFNQPSTSRDSNTTSQPRSDSHVPPPPSDLDFMELEYDDHTEQATVHTSLKQTTSSSTRNSGRRAGSKLTLSDGFDVMDAIFGVENLNDVAEEGNEFGFGVERHKSLSSQSYSDLREKERISPKTSVHTSRRHSPCRTICEEEQDTQDSIINDSGFLPSTPPAKKHKAQSYPALFGMDMFSSQHCSAEVLAPDSDSEEQ